MGTAVRVIRKFRNLFDVTFGTPNDGDVPIYDLGTNKLVMGAPPGGPPSGPAAGVLDGNYPNPGLAAAVAGAGLAETANVLSVNVDGTTVEIAADAVQVKDGGITPTKLSFDPATQAELDAHINDASDAHDHGALTGLADDDHPQYHNDARGDVRYWQLSTDLATQVELDAHLSDASDAHDASAVSVDSATLSGVGTDVQAVFEEIDNLLDDHSGRHENNGPDELSVAGLSGELADAQPVTIRRNTGADVGTRSRLNFIEGSNVTLTVADDAGSDEVDVTIAASGSSVAADDENLVLHVNLLAI